MNVYIQTDIEGVAGWVSFEDRASKSVESFHHRQRMYRLLTGEVAAAAQAALDAGAERVVVNDSHGSGYNIFFEDLPEPCEINHGRSSAYPHWLPALDDSFDALVLVGMHAMGATEHAVCPHSKWVVNDGDLFLSEGSMAMALAGDVAVPCVFASGDQAITAELKEKRREMETAVVKFAYGPYCARSLTPARARKLISDGVRRGLERRGEVPPYRIPGPVRLNLLDAPGHTPPLQPVFEEDVEGATIGEAFGKACERFEWFVPGAQDVDGYRFPDNLIPPNR